MDEFVPPNEISSPATTFDSAARIGGDQVGVAEATVAAAELVAEATDAVARGTAGAAVKMCAAADAGAAADTAAVVPVVAVVEWLEDRRFTALGVMATGSWLAVRLPAYTSLRATVWVAAVLMASGLFRIADPALTVAGFFEELVPGSPAPAECGEADCEVSAWARPDPLAIAAPKPNASAPTPSHW